MTEPSRDALIEAINDLWSCIDAAEVKALQPETVQLCKQLHEEEWHS